MFVIKEHILLTLQPSVSVTARSNNEPSLKNKQRKKNTAPYYDPQGVVNGHHLTSKGLSKDTS